MAVVIALYICSFMGGADHKCDRGMLFDSWDACYDMRSDVEQAKGLEAYCEEVDVAFEVAR